MSLSELHNLQMSSIVPVKQFIVVAKYHSFKINNKIIILRLKKIISFLALYVLISVG